MKQRHAYDDLDRMLDDLNENREPADLTDDLAELVEMARGLKELGHTTWPDHSFPLRTAMQLSRELNPVARATPVSFTPHLNDGDPEATGEVPPLPLPERGLPSPMPLTRTRSSNLRRTLEIAAAAVVLVLFTALIATLLGNNGDTPEPTTQANAGASFGAAPAASATAPQTTAPAVTGQNSTATAPATTAPATSDASLPASVSDPVLAALQSGAGFDLYAPTALPQGLTMVQPAEPPKEMGQFTSVVLKYQSANGNDALTIIEASPYKDSAQTMPSDIFYSSVPADLGNGVTVAVYQTETNIQIWWEVGPTSIRLESGGPAGTTLLGKDVMLDIARSMVPVEPATPATPAANGVTRETAIATARTLLSSLGGHADAETGNVLFTTVVAQTALGMPEPTGMDENAPRGVEAAVTNQYLLPYSPSVGEQPVCSRRALFRAAVPVS